MTPTFSILIRSLESRKQKLDHLLRSLYVQLLALSPERCAEVEILFDVDNKEVTSGEKANRLLDKARGKYIAFIDDDDHVYDNYVRDNLTAMESDADCIASRGHYSTNGGHKTLWKLSKDHNNHDVNENGVTIHYRKANHISAVKREYAIQARFPHISNAEDKAYSERLNQYLKTETTILEPIYHYDYETSNKQY